jgi:hypothetical protein
MSYWGWEILLSGSLNPDPSTTAPFRRRWLGVKRLLFDRWVTNSRRCNHKLFVAGVLVFREVLVHLFGPDRR